MGEVKLITPKKWSYIAKKIVLPIVIEQGPHCFSITSQSILYTYPHKHTHAHMVKADIILRTKELFCYTIPSR